MPLVLLEDNEMQCTSNVRAYVTIFINYCMLIFEHKIDCVDVDKK